jgi:organic radical activating enzyme
MLAAQRFFAALRDAICGVAAKRIVPMPCVNFAILTLLVRMAMAADHRYVVFTGGEPLLQLDADLINALHALHFEIAIETNGTLPVPKGVDWVCVSPKAGSELVVLQADEMKLVIPQAGHDQLEQLLTRFERMDYRHRYIQPMDGPLRSENTALAVSICQKRPLWRLSLQTHKWIGIR